MRETSPGISDGRKPKTDADFVTLKQHGIRTILSLQTMSSAVEREGQQAEQRGFCFRNVPILASPLAPPEERVKEALQILATPSLRPIYIHCLRGHDRTGVLLALYHVYYENWTPETAWQNMRRSGDFKWGWRMIGFEVYFWRHSRKPDWAKVSSPSETRR